MKNTGRAPCLRTMSHVLLAVLEEYGLSCGWIGHWLQSIMIAVELPIELVED